MNTYKLEKKLPKYLLVAKIKDLFWNNNSDLYPSSVPPLSEYTFINEIQPTFQSPYLGTIRLQGEWNHCFYNQKYWFLIKLEVQDVANEVYVYQMILDVMITFLYEGGSVKGTVIRTNKPELLDSVIQTCQPILSDPCKLHLLSYDTETYDWKKNAVFNIPNKNYLSELINNSYDLGINEIAWKIFIEKAKTHPWLKVANKDERIQKHDEIAKEFFVYDKDRNLFVLDYIEPHYTLGWKLNVMEAIAEQWPTGNVPNKAQLLKDKVITTVTQFTGAAFVGKLALCPSSRSLGSHIENDVTIFKVDLTGVKDIVPLTVDGTPLEPVDAPTLDMLDNTTEYVEVPKPILRLAQQAYLPEEYNRGRYDTDNNFGNWAEEIQIDSGSGDKYDSQKVWFLPRNNIALVRMFISSLFMPKSSHRLVSTSYYDYWQDYLFYKLPRRWIPPVGFKINQHLKQPDLWDGYEYVGLSNTKEFEYLSDLNVNALQVDYSNDQKKWWNLVKNHDGNIDYIKNFLLDLDLFSHLNILPATNIYEYRGYKYLWNREYGVKEVFKDRSLYYVSAITSADISAAGDYIQNPFHPDRIHDWLLRRQHLLEKYTIKGVHEMPNAIKKGDIVFTTGDYAFYPIIHYSEDTPFHIPKTDIDAFSLDIYKYKLEFSKANSSIKYYYKTNLYPESGYKNVPALRPTNPDANTHHSWQWLTTAATAPYLFVPPLEQLSFTSNTVLAFTYYKGKFHFRIIDSFRPKWTAYPDTRVNVGPCSDTIYHITTCGPEISYKAPVNSDQELAVFKEAISKMTGGKRGKVHYFSKEKLKKGSYIFDLVGTDWYAAFVEGDISLIAKQNSNFSKQTTTMSKLKTTSNELSTYERINQKATLNFYGEDFPLNTRFKLKDDTFPVQYQEISPPDKFSSIAYYHITCTTPHDYINTWTKISKKMSVSSAAEIDPIQLDMLRHQIDGVTLRYEQDQVDYELKMRKKNIDMVRRRVDLDMEWWDHTVNSATTVINAGAEAFTGGIKSIDIGGKITPGHISATSNVAKLAYDIYAGYRNYNIKSARLEEDKGLLYAENVNRIFHRKQNYEQEFKANLIHLNSMTKRVIKGGINDREIQEEYNTKNNLSNIHIKVFSPTEEQQRVINKIYQTFGCECVCDEYVNTPLPVKSGQIEGLYQFRKILDDSFRSPLTQDPLIRDNIKYCFEVGVRFKHTNIEFIAQTFDREEEFEATVIKKVDFDVENIPDWRRDKWIHYYSVTDQNDVLEAINKLEHKGLTQEEWNTNPDVANATDSDLIDLVNEIISHRLHGEVYIPPQRPIIVKVDSAELDRLNETIRDLKHTDTESRNKVKELTDNLETTNTKLTKLQEDHTKIEEEVTEYRKLDVPKLKEEKEDLTKKLHDMTVAKEELEEKHNEALRRAINEKDEINKLKADLEACKKIKPSSVVFGKDIINQLFPTSNKTKYSDVPEVIINKTKGSLLGNKGSFSGAYYKLTYMIGSTPSNYYSSPTETYAWVYKPVAKISHKVAFVQNLMNCFWDCFWGSTHRIPKVNAIFATHHIFTIGSVVPYKSNYYPQMDRNSFVVISEDHFDEEDRMIVRMICNAVLRTSRLMNGIYEGSYIRYAGLNAPDETPQLTRASAADFFNAIYFTNVCAYLFADTTTIYKWFQYLIHTLRNNEWDDAYNKISNTIEDWDWLDPHSYPG